VCDLSAPLLELQYPTINRNAAWLLPARAFKTAARHRSSLSGLRGRRIQRDLTIPLLFALNSHCAPLKIARLSSFRRHRYWHPHKVAPLVQYAFLCQLGRSIAAALRAVPETAEASRTHLRSMRATLHAAIDARCDDLEAGLSRAESAKVAALERELVAVDAALERWRSETRVVQDAVATLSDAELMSRHAELIARLEGLEAQLRALPTAPVEPPHVGLTMDTSALLASIAGFGRIVAPLGISAADVTLEGVPSHVRPGQTLQLRLALGARHAEQSTEELHLSLRGLTAAVRFEVTLCALTTDNSVFAPVVLTHTTH